MVAPVVLVRIRLNNSEPKKNSQLLVIKSVLVGLLEQVFVAVGVLGPGFLKAGFLKAGFLEAGFLEAGEVAAVEPTSGSEPVGLLGRSEGGRVGLPKQTPPKSDSPNRRPSLRWCEPGRGRGICLEELSTL